MTICVAAQDAVCSKGRQAGREGEGSGFGDGGGDGGGGSGGSSGDESRAVAVAAAVVGLRRREMAVPGELRGAVGHMRSAAAVGALGERVDDVAYRVKGGERSGDC